MDYTTIFDEPTATHLVETLQPEIYAKGGDYAPGSKPLPEAAAVEQYGGTVRIIPFVEGHSASDLIRRTIDDGR